MYFFGNVFDCNALEGVNLCLVSCFDVRLQQRVISVLLSRLHIADVVVARSVLSVEIKILLP